jgi:hypothetical protein
MKYDGFWKKKNEDGIPSEFYFVKVSREGGEGKAEGVTGLVGIVDKLDLKEAGWLSSNMRSVDIITNKYLLLYGGISVTETHSWSSDKPVTRSPSKDPSATAL